MRTAAALSMLVLLAGCSQIVEPSIVITVHAPQAGIVEPVQGAQVLLSNDIHGGLTDGQGRVAMYGVEQGAYNVTVRWDEQERIQRIVVNGTKVELTFLLNETEDAALSVQVFTMESPGCEGCAGGPIPAVGAVVLLGDNRHGGRTGPEGMLSFFELDEGAYNVTVLWGGEQQTQTVVLDGDEAPVVRFTFLGSARPEEQAA